MSFTVTLIGIIKKIEEATIRGNFESRKFIVEEEKDRYGNIWPVEAQQGRVNVMDGYRIGERIIVTCEVNGREWTKETTGDVSHFLTLKMLTIQRLADFQNPTPAGAKQASNSAAQKSPELQQQWDAKYGPNGTGEGMPANVNEADDLPF